MHYSPVSGNFMRNSTWHRLAALGAIALILCVGVLPFVGVLGLSFLDYSISNANKTFAPTTGNYARASHDPYLLKSVMNTTVFAGTATFLQLAMGTVFAVAICRLSRSRLLLTLMLLPCLVSPVVVGGLARLLLHGEYGPLALGVRSLLTTTDRFSILGDPLGARLSLLLVDTWQWTPFVACLAALAIKSIPASVGLAAACDGASPFKVSTKIVVPMVSPVLAVVAVMRFLDASREFEKTLVMTNGGPASATESLAIYTSRVAFDRGDVGYAAAISVLAYLLTAGLVWLMLRRFRGWRA